MATTFRIHSPEDIPLDVVDRVSTDYMGSSFVHTTDGVIYTDVRPPEEVRAAIEAAKAEERRQQTEVFIEVPKDGLSHDDLYAPALFPPIDPEGGAYVFPQVYENVVIVEVIH